MNSSTQDFLSWNVSFPHRSRSLLAHNRPVQVPLELPSARGEDGGDQGDDEDLPQDRGPLHPHPPPSQGGSEVIREREEILLSASLHLLVSTNLLTKHFRFISTLKFTGLAVDGRKRSLIC